MFFRTLVAGLLTGILFGGANAALELSLHWNLTNLMALIFPAGAFVLAAAGAAGCALVTDLRADRGSADASLFASGAFVGLATVTAYYFSLYQYSILPDLLTSRAFSFFAFLNEYFAGMRLTDGGGELGGFGVFLGWSDFAGGLLGGAGGALAIASWRRRKAGVNAVPSLAQDFAAVLVEVAYADGELSPDEMSTAFRMLRAHFLEHYDPQEGEDTSSIDELVNHLTIQKFEEARSNPIALDAHLTRLAQASPTTRHLILLGSTFVSLCDGELANEEIALLREIATKLGFSDTELHNALATATSQLEQRWETPPEEAIEGGGESPRDA